MSMFSCLFLCIDSLINSLVSFVVFFLSYSFGDIVNIAFLCPRRNSVAMGPNIPWWSIVKGSILYLFLMSSADSSSDVEFDFA